MSAPDSFWILKIFLAKLSALTKSPSNDSCCSVLFKFGRSSAAFAFSVSLSSFLTASMILLAFWFGSFARCSISLLDDSTAFGRVFSFSYVPVSRSSVCKILPEVDSVGSVDLEFSSSFLSRVSRIRVRASRFSLSSGVWASFSRVAMSKSSICLRVSSSVSSCFSLRIVTGPSFGPRITIPFRMCMRRLWSFVFQVLKLLICFFVKSSGSLFFSLASGSKFFTRVLKGMPLTTPANESRSMW